MREEVYIHSVEKSDLDEIVKLHCELFDTYFLKNLGYKLIYKYYLAYFQDEGTIFLKATHSNEIVGFVLTTSNYSAIIHRFYREHFLELSSKILWETLKLNKTIFSGLKSRLFNLFKSSNQNDDEVEEEVNCLLSIAVKPEFRGKAVAKLLVDTVEEKLIAEDVRAYSLSVKKDNPRAQHFYEKIGFKKIGGKGELDYYTKELLLKEGE